MKQAKKAISLIKLVGVMLVIIFIGTSLVLLVADGLDISGNKESKFKAMLETYSQSLDSYMGKMYMQTSGGFSEPSLNADLETLEYNGIVHEGNIFDVLPTLDGSKYQKKIRIRNGKIDVTAFKGKELTWAKEQLQDAITEEPKKEEIKKREDIGEGTNLLEEAIQNKMPYVPDEFNYVEGTVETGYVISDKFGNEYVWIPVSDTSIFDNDTPRNNNAEDESVTTFNAMKTSVGIYGGFYIGRYEASNVNGKVATAKNMIPWNNMKLGDNSKNSAAGAYSLSKKVSEVYEYSTFKSTLVYNSMWEATLQFIGKTNDRNSLAYGNYNGSSFEIDNSDARGSRDNGKTYGYIAKKTVNAKVILTTGAATRNSVKNIYDMAGNLSEWVISPSNLSRNIAYVRGGDYSDLSNTVSIRYTVERNITETRENIGFRIALYI